jgi:hypothetical protein
MQWFSTQDKEFKAFMTWMHIFQAYHFQDLQIKHGTRSAFAAKRSLGFSTR